MMLLEHSGGFLQPMLQSLSGFQLLEVLGPLALPVEGEAAQAEHGHTQAEEAAIGDPVQVTEQGRLAIRFARRQRTLDQFQGPSGGSPLTLLGLMQWGGDHRCAAELRK
jgi:hypothetical protein